MGSWGVRVEDNDTARDFLTDVILGAYDKAKNNDEVLVVIGLMEHYGESMTYLKIKNEMQEVINEELSERFIGSWKDDCKEDRIKELTKLKSYLENVDVYKE